MASSPPPRILLAGDVLGRLHQLFKRVQSVNKSTGPFDALVCVGQFFPDSADGVDEVADYVEGRAVVPLPTYFTGDYGVAAARFLSVVSKLPENQGFKTDGLQLCPNLFWLKGSGKFSLRGLSVVYLSGRRSSGAGGEYNDDDVDALRALAEEPGIVDLFLTNEWPSGVSNGADISNAPPGVKDPSGCDPVVAELAAEIKPRYHIAGTKGIFFAREPYTNKEVVHVTRFLGLAAVGNKDKQKFIHAISPTPASAMSSSEIHARPPNTTFSPYIVLGKTDTESGSSKRPANDDPATQYWRFDVSQKRQRQGGTDEERLCFTFTSSGSCPRAEKCRFRHDAAARQQYMRNVCFDFLNKGRCEKGPDCKFGHSLVDEDTALSQKTRSHSGRGSLQKPCWFCLSSPDVESHLILSISENYYCALAKGPLVDDHVLLIPIEHCPNTLMMPLEMETELGNYRKALNMYYKKQEKVVIFFEWVSPQSPHANLQSVPVPLSKLSNVKRIFNLAAKKLGFEFEVLKPDDEHSQGRELLRSQFTGNSVIFYVELPEGTILVHTVDNNEKFPIQFGREVLAGLLNIADRADWKDCKLSKQEEEQMVEGFKKGFAEFDPAR